MPHKRSGKSTKASLTAKSAVSNPKHPGLPHEVAAIREEIRAFYEIVVDGNGTKLGNVQCGVYAFYDYDGEPIYIGQTYEGFSDRIGRHLTGQRSDAVAMSVLDPFEVAEVRAWPLDLAHLTTKAEKGEYLDRAEFTLFQKVIAESGLRAVLNEKPPTKLGTIDLPKCYSKRIIPEAIYPHRKHPDVRIARRASTIASLARVISERKASRGLRQTLLTQARRLQRLAEDRLKDFSKEETDELGE